MTFSVRFSRKAELDLYRIFQFIVERKDPDLAEAERALGAIQQAIEDLQTFPFRNQPTSPANSYLRELVASYGTAKFFLIYEVDSNDMVTVLGVRHHPADRPP